MWGSRQHRGCCSPGQGLGGGGGALLWGTAAAPHSTHRGGGAGSMQHPSHSGLGAGSVRPHRDVGSMGTGKRRGCARVTVYGDSPRIQPGPPTHSSAVAPFPSALL